VPNKPQRKIATRHAKYAMVHTMMTAPSAMVVIIWTETYYFPETLASVILATKPAANAMAVVSVTARNAHDGNEHL
jgi:hypothetical protein